MKRMQQRDADSERERSKESSAPASKRERTSAASASASSSSSSPTPPPATSATQSPSASLRDREDRDRDRDRERERERDRLRHRGARFRDRRGAVDYYREYRDYHYWHYYDSDSESDSSVDRTKRLADQLTIKALNNNQVFKNELQQMPSRLMLVASLPQAPPEVALAHSWSPTDHSVNVYVREDDPFTFHRQPIAQSTDSIRTKQGYSRGIHVFQIWWSRRQRGTHAVVGVGTQDADTHCVGYQALVGANRESWGWDIGRLRLVHDAQRTASAANGAQTVDRDNHTNNQSQRERARAAQDAWNADAAATASSTADSNSRGGNEPNANGNSARNDTANVNVHNKAYPACWTGASIANDATVVPERFFMVLDCDEGTLSFVANDQFLGVAIRGLRGKTLYPMISAVWGHGEVTMRYYNGIDEPLALRDFCRYALRQHFGNDRLGLIDRLPLPKPIIDYLLYRAPSASASATSSASCSLTSLAAANANSPSPLSVTAHNDDSNLSTA